MRTHLVTGLVVLAIAASSPGQKPPAEAPKPVPSAVPNKLSGPQWRLQYFYDKARETLNIRDVRFASPQRGVAVGVIFEGRRQKPVSVATSDGGATWQVNPLEERPLSLFFLNETAGWMVAEGGLWRTVEAGRSWRKLRNFPSGMWVVHFLDEKNGIAAGVKKRVYRTVDGGERWTAVAAAAEPPGDAKYSVYNWIAFATPQAGIVSGYNRPPSRFTSEFPEWMDPESALYRREVPHLSYTLGTLDGGATWKSSSASVLGQITRIRLTPNGVGVGLMEFGNGFRVPSEVYRLDWRSGKNQPIYRDERLAVTDVWQNSAGTIYLAGIRVAAQVRGLAPGKVVVMESRNSDASVWSEIRVDYRAVAQRVIFAGSDGHLWLATDNGMILKLER